MNKANAKLIAKKHKIKVELSVTATRAAQRIREIQGKVISGAPVIFKQLD